MRSYIAEDEVLKKVLIRHFKSNGINPHEDRHMHLYASISVMGAAIKFGRRKALKAVRVLQSTPKKKRILHYCVIATKMNVVKRAVGRKQNKTDRKNAKREQIETNLENKRNRSGEKKRVCLYIHEHVCSVEKKGEKMKPTLYDAHRAIEEMMRRYFYCTYLHCGIQVEEKEAPFKFHSLSQLPFLVC